MFKEYCPWLKEFSENGLKSPGLKQMGPVELNLECHPYHCLFTNGHSLDNVSFLHTHSEEQLYLCLNLTLL